MKLSGIRPGGPFAGLPENTVCFELNGAKLDGVQALPQALVSSVDGQVCLRCRQPDGVETHAMPVALLLALLLLALRGRRARAGRDARGRRRWSRSTSRTRRSPR